MPPLIIAALLAGGIALTIGKKSNKVQIPPDETKPEQETKPDEQDSSENDSD